MLSRVHNGPCQREGDATMTDTRDEIAHGTSRDDLRVVVNLFDRGPLRRDECFEVTFAAVLDTSSDWRRDHGHRLDGDACGFRIVDGATGETVAREVSQRDREAAEWAAECLIDRSGLLARWDAAARAGE